MPETIAFYTFAGLAILASALVIGQRNPMYSVMLLIASFGALAGLYIGLDAPFAAVTQIIVYAGAIMVLFLFVVMLLNAAKEDGAEYDRLHPLRHPAVTRFGTLLAVLLVVQLGCGSLLLLPGVRVFDRRLVLLQRTLGEQPRVLRELARTVYGAEAGQQRGRRPEREGQ